MNKKNTSYKALCWVFLALVIVQIGSVSAEMTWDNVGTFEQVGTYGRYVIKDLFGLGGTVQIV